MQITKKILEQSFEEHIKTLPNVLIKCKNDTTFSTKMLWFFKDAEGISLLFNNDILNGEIILDESDYLFDNHDAERIIKFMSCEDFRLFNKKIMEDGKIIKSIQYNPQFICQALKFYEKYMIIDMYDLLINKLIKDNCYKKNMCQLIEMLYCFNQHNLEKKDNLFYKQIISTFRTNLHDIYTRKIFKNIGNGDYFDNSIILQIQNDVFNY